VKPSSRFGIASSPRWRHAAPQGLIQDHVVTGVLMTKRDSFFTKEEYHQVRRPQVLQRWRGASG